MNLDNYHTCDVINSERRTHSRACIYTCTFYKSCDFPWYSHYDLSVQHVTCKHSDWHT